MIAPPYFSIPAGYGGIEVVVADLVDALVDRGHEVTLIGTGRHATKAQRFHRHQSDRPADRLGEAMPELVHAAKVAPSSAAERRRDPRPHAGRTADWPADG